MRARFLNVASLVLFLAASTRGTRVPEALASVGGSEDYASDYESLTHHHHHHHKHEEEDCVPREVSERSHLSHPSKLNDGDQVHLALSESTEELRLVWQTTAFG